MSDVSRVEEIFISALAKVRPDDRAAYLDEECRGQTELRRQVDALLAAHPDARRFLESQRVGVTQDLQSAACSEQVGTVVAGQYKLLERIGEGGMGQVWVADQLTPLKRRVALKLIKPGMDSRSVLGRFDAERQALAVMDHPNIARVLDAGATSDARPFFVMELVKGTQITEFCDSRRLTAEQRLELFVPVCQAIQHAHMKGIIHRDIKPSNVLVALHDENPVPKVIDFGVAKAIGQQLTDQTIYTGFGSLIGTPTYMAPEQATFNQLDVDTRADVYTLGVLLYELLAGSPPIESARLKRAALDEVLKIVRDEKPPRPSQRLSTSQARASISSLRQSDPTRLSQLMKGEIDWIVMKALEKDRARRYESAHGFAADIKRYLDGEAVQAHPPSAAYRLRKFLGKHRVAFATTSAFIGLLIAAAAISFILAVKARWAEVDAETNANKARRSSDLYKSSLRKEIEARREAEVATKSLQIDLDVAEARDDRRVGLLRLVRSARPRKADRVPAPTDPSDAENSAETGFREEGSDQIALREFASMTVLAIGQTYAPLLPPITHDGHPIRESYRNPSGDRILTLGTEQTARLWDGLTGRQIAVLRIAKEAVIEAGMSPDGVIAFTHSLDGVVRVWSAKDGALRAATAPRPGRFRLLGDPIGDPYADLGSSSYRMTSLSNDRVLTQCQTYNGQTRNTRADPPADATRRLAELWDATTGALIASLPASGEDDLRYKFVVDGRWIVDRSDRYSVVIHSGADGRKVGVVSRSDHGDKPYFSFLHPSGVVVSPSESAAASVGTAGEGWPWFIHLWDTRTWQLKCVAAWSIPWPMKDPKIQFIDDHTLAVNDGNVRLIHDTDAAPFLVVSSELARIEGDLALFRSGQIFNHKKGRRLEPPKGRKYHPAMTRFAPDGRFVPLRDDAGQYQLLDAKTEKITLVGTEMEHFLPGQGWLGGWVAQGTVGPIDNGLEVALQRLPEDPADIPANLLELWSQVVVRGALDDEGVFIKWDESTWEMKWRELAAASAPNPAFPFPGRVASDRMHWLRQEFKDADDADKPRLAKQLLVRAGEVGDQSETTRWRAWISTHTQETK